MVLRLGFPISVWFSCLWHTVGVWLTKGGWLSLTFWTGYCCNISNCVHAMADVTYENDFYVHPLHAHIVMNADPLLARLIFFHSVISQLKKIAVSVSCSVFSLLQGISPCQQLNHSWITLDWIQKSTCPLTE